MFKEIHDEEYTVGGIEVPRAPNWLILVYLELFGVEAAPMLEEDIESLGVEGRKGEHTHPF
jgi:hypothetical protein